MRGGHLKHFALALGRKAGEANAIIGGAYLSA